jgi:EcsC protein family
MVAVGASSGDDNSSSLAQTTLNWIVEAGVEGFLGLPAAEEVAADHLKDAGGNIEEAIDSIIAWRTAYSAGTGFVTGLGGIATMPLTIPTGLAASYAIGANTAAAIACLRGYDVTSEKVKTFILLSLVGKGATEVLSHAGVQIGAKITQNLIKQIPGKVLIEINKKIGFRLVTKAGEKGVFNLMKFVPVVGGLVGGAFDAVFVNSCGQAAKNVFSQVE